MKNGELSIVRMGEKKLVTLVFMFFIFVFVFFFHKITRAYFYDNVEQFC